MGAHGEHHRFSTLPDPKLVLLDNHGGREIVPLRCAGRLPPTAARSLHALAAATQATKRYQGGYNETLWRFDGRGEAVPLTADKGHLHQSDVLESAPVFLSDRDGG